MNSFTRTLLSGIAAMLIATTSLAQSNDLDCTQCVDMSDIAAKAVTNGKLAPAAVTRDKLRAGSVSRAKLANDAVSTAKIRDGAVTIDKVAPQLSNTIGTYCAPAESVVGVDDNGNLVCEGSDVESIEAQVRSAIPLASELRYLFAEFFRFSGEFPQTNYDAGALLASEYTNRFVASVHISNDKIVALFANEAAVEIAFETLEFIPYIDGREVHFVCNPTGNVADFFDPSWCVLNDEPPEPLTTTRRQARSAIPLASEARWMVQDFYFHHGFVPTSNEMARLPEPLNIAHGYVVSVAVSDRGWVTATYGNSAHSDIADRTITFIPRTMSSNAFHWVCSYGIHSRFSGPHPSNDDCVLPIDEPPKVVSVTRQQFRSGYPIAELLQSLVKNYYDTNASWPSGNAQVGAANPEDYNNGYVESATVLPGGEIALLYRNNVHRRIDGAILRFTPTDNGAAIEWVCTVNNDNDLRYAPWECD